MADFKEMYWTVSSYVLNPTLLKVELGLMAAGGLGLMGYAVHIFRQIQQINMDEQPSNLEQRLKPIDDFTYSTKKLNIFNKRDKLDNAQLFTRICDNNYNLFNRI